MAILTEMITFLRNMKGRPEALAGKNDDVIMSASIAYAVLQEIGTYVAQPSDSEGFSYAKAIFGEPQSPDRSPIHSQYQVETSAVREL